MITELMIILIVVGAIIVFVAWTSARKRKHDEDERRDAEDATEKFKQDLEKTANEIIGRMESQAARLEKLLNDSEHSRTQLEGRIAEFKKLIRKAESQTIELKELLTRLDDSVEEINSLQRQTISKIPARQPAKTPAPMLLTPQPAPRPVESFAKVLESSMAEKKPVRRSEHLIKADNLELSEVEKFSDSSSIREMLRSGMTVEEVAKETGLGRGAIMLVQQMMRRSRGLN